MDEEVLGLADLIRRWEYFAQLVIHPNLVSTLQGLGVMVVDLYALTRLFFNPLYFGSLFLVLFVWAWFRMEAIAESKRTSMNNRILAKKSIGQLHMSLKDYSDRFNGKIFMTNGVFDVIKSVTSKGRVPLKAASICQPVLPSLGDNILWESNCVKIRGVFQKTDQNEAKINELFQAVRQKAVLSIRDALHILSLGGEALWRDPRRRIFSKERLVSLKFNFFDPSSFICLFRDSNGFKRICSESVDSFFGLACANVETQEIEFEKTTSSNPYGIEKIKIPDETFFSAVALLLCHGAPSN